ncbi:D-inositol 3-phosphate glycosyltransferase [bacterium HR33]|nr:D-inositol 3-phosphate glycosyltransferase [bacterium HR33]
MSPKVLAVSFFSSRGPVADNFVTLARAFSRWVDLWVLSTTLVEGRLGIRAQGECYVEFHKSRLGSWIDLELWRRVLAFTRREEFDLLFLYSEHPLHVPIALAARARRVAFWCLDPVHHSGAKPHLAAVYEFAKRSLLRRATSVIVACEQLKEATISKYRLAPERIVVSPHGVLDNLAFPEIRSETRDIDVLFFGRVERYKGVDVLLRALELLAARGTRTRAVVAGPGDSVRPAAGVERIARYLEDRELAALIARSKMVVMPYRDATGSQVAQCSFYYGTPVIATRVGCLPEYVEHEVTGLLVAPERPEALAEAIQRLMLDQALWTRLSQRARQEARHRFANQELARHLLERILPRRES